MIYKISTMNEQEKKKKAKDLTEKNAPKDFLEVTEVKELERQCLIKTRNKTC